MSQSFNQFSPVALGISFSTKGSAEKRYSPTLRSGESRQLIEQGQIAKSQTALVLYDGNADTGPALSALHLSLERSAAEIFRYSTMGLVTRHPLGMDQTNHRTNYLTYLSIVYF